MRVLQGSVAANRMNRTVVVRVDRLAKHPKHHKFYRVSRRYKADVNDEKSYGVGDVVKIQETRPISKEKRWRVIEIVKKAPQEESFGDDPAGDAEQT